MSIVYCVPFNLFSQRMKLDDKKKLFWDTMYQIQINQSQQYWLSHKQTGPTYFENNLIDNVFFKQGIIIF